jgi:hypothetical protein
MDRLLYIESLIEKGQTLDDATLMEYGLKKKPKGIKEPKAPREPREPRERKKAGGKKPIRFDYKLVDHTMPVHQIAKIMGCHPETARQMRYKKLLELGLVMDIDKVGRYRSAPRAKSSQETINKIIEMHEAGCILRVIGEAVSLNPASVHWHISRYKVKKRRENDTSQH